MWKNLKNIQIPGSIWAPALVGAMLGTTGVLFITLPISQTNDNTLGESIFGKNESLEIQIKIKNEGELHLKATGATTMEVLTNLKQMLKNMEQNLLLEQSSPYTPL
tara:strand:+ start:35 stop:352 length:318 start_codon:yes stop_codon:yes gene_type:complete